VPRVLARAVAMTALLLTVLSVGLMGSEPIPAGAVTAIRVPEDYASIQAAIDAASAGDVIDVAAGTYAATLTVDVAVTIRGRTYVVGDPTANTTILDGGGASVVTIPARVTPAPSLVGLVFANGDSGVVTNSVVNVSHSSFVGNSGDALEFEPGGGGRSINNVFADSGDDAIDLDHMVNDVRIVRNRIFDSGDDGIEIRLHDDTIAERAELLIRSSEIAGSGEDGLQIIDYDTDTNRRIVVKGSLIHTSAMAAIGLMDSGATKEDYRGASVRERVVVVHNTFVDNDRGISGGDNLIALNNIFEGHGVALSSVDGASVASHNLFWMNDVNAQYSVVHRRTSVFADPSLDARFRLPDGSAAIDAGTAYFEWQGDVVMDQPASRYRGDAPDIGWHERRR
jgi:hypothetical protein